MYYKCNDPETAKNTGNEGFVVHFVSDQEINALKKFLLFRDYLNAHEDARKKYADCKRANTSPAASGDDKKEG